MKLVNIYSGVLVYFFGFGETKSYQIPGLFIPAAMDHV